MIVVIPAYEPDEKLLGVIRDFTEQTAYPILVVNDGSSESCRPVFDAAASNARVTLLEHECNKGKGAALKTAFAYIGEHYPDTEAILTVDADGQHLLKDCLKVCDAYLSHPDMLITGSRLFKGKVPLRSRLGNSITRGVFHLTTGKRVHDTQTGLRAFSAKRVPEMVALNGDRYEYEIHQLLHCCTGSTGGVYEVPIETVYIDDNSSSHFDTLHDSWKIYKVIFKYLGPTFLKFMSTSFLSFLVDFLSFCLIFYGTIAAFGGLSIAKEMFSFDRSVTSKWAETLLALNPVVFVGGGSVLRIVSLVLARVISGLCNYLLNRRFVFHARKQRSLFRYAIVAASVLVLNWILIELFTLLGIPAWLANICAQLICYPISFMLQRAIVFRQQAS